MGNKWLRTSQKAGGTLLALCVVFGAGIFLDRVTNCHLLVLGSPNADGVIVARYVPLMNSATPQPASGQNTIAPSSQ